MTESDWGKQSVIQSERKREIQVVSQSVRVRDRVREVVREGRMQSVRSVRETGRERERVRGSQSERERDRGKKKVSQ